MNGKNTVDSTCEQWGTPKENKNCKETCNYNQKEIVGISGLHHEERGTKEFSTHRMYWKQMSQEEMVRNLFIKFIWMNLRTETKIKSYSKKKQEIVENHDQQHPEKISYVKEEYRKTK